MPAGVINNLDTIEKSSYLRNKYVLIIFCLIMFFILFSKRIFNIQDPNFIIYVTAIVIGLFIVIILSTFLDVAGYSSYNYLGKFNKLFNSPASRNFLAIITLVFFVIFVYEAPNYGNNNQHHLIDVLTFHNNKYISNRTAGMLLIMSFTILTAYTIYLTTKDSI